MPARARRIQRHLVRTRRARDRVVQRADAARHRAGAGARGERAPADRGRTGRALHGLRRPAPPPASIKTLPQRTAVVVTNQGYGLNVIQARFVPYPGTPGLCVIPGSHGVSMVQIRPDGGGGGNNVPVSMALSGGMITTTGSAPHRETVWGLVPDGNPSITVVLAGGATRTVRVIDNVYSITLTRRAVAVIAKNARGRQVTIRVPG